METLAGVLHFLPGLVLEGEWGSEQQGPAAACVLATFLGRLEVSQLTGPQGSSGWVWVLPRPRLPSSRRARGVGELWAGYRPRPRHPQLLMTFPLPPGFMGQSSCPSRNVPTDSVPA